MGGDIHLSVVQLNLQGLKNLDIDQTQNARAIIRHLRAKLTQVGKDQLVIHINDLIQIMLCLYQ